MTTISLVQPSTAPAGAQVTIAGSGFTGATAVKFGATNATSFTVLSNNVITAVVPPGSGSVLVTVVAPSGTSNGVSFAYTVPAITAISPTSGPATGGTSVTVIGSGFTGATAVKFGATNATSFTVLSDNVITAVSPPGAGTVQVTVVTPGGTSNGVTYNYVPTLTSLSPTSGPAAGGTVVTLTGTGFTGVTAVTFGGTPATSFTVNSNTQITATAPAHVAGTAAVTVTGPGGTSNSLPFTYIPVPVVIALSPSSGPATGGTSVTIIGTGFTGATAVKFGATNATSFTVLSNNVITAVSPPGAGTVQVTVVTPGGTSNGAAYNYTGTPVPTLTSLNPTSGLAAGGTVVTLTGTGFIGTTAVTFGGTPATSFTVNSDTQITATAPAGTGTVQVQVTTP
ncbi:IPT/TIG domain-containing protein, partial [Streptomyces avermitilis]|uniref:IPT/TIG domain-containing protein n=1 Tax=Streptomyces avermitilis TaxID=33903 RepID=UPI0036958B46